MMLHRKHQLGKKKKKKNYDSDIQIQYRLYSDKSITHKRKVHSNTTDDCTGLIVQKTLRIEPYLSRH